MPTTLTRDLATFQDRADALVHEHPRRHREPVHAWFATGAADRRRRAAPHRAVLRLQPPVPRGAAAQGLQRRDRSSRTARQGDPPERARRRLPARRTAARRRRRRRSRARRDRGQRRGQPLQVRGRALRVAAALRCARSASSSPISASARTARPSTLHFCDELLRLYGSDDPSIGRGRVVRGRALGRGRVLEAAHRRARGRSRPASARSCRSRSGPGTTRSRTSTPRTPPTSWPRSFRCPASTRTGSSPARTRCSTACRRSGTASTPTALATATRRGAPA